MGTTIRRLCRKILHLVKTDEDTGETIISGMGELHLEIIVDRMFREFKLEANVGKPQVAYKETVLKTAEAEGKYIRQSVAEVNMAMFGLELFLAREVWF